MSKPQPPLPVESDPTTRPEYLRIRASIKAVLREDRIGLFDAALDKITLAMFRILEGDRATSSTLLGLAFEQFAPLDQDKVRRIQQVIEGRIDLRPGLCVYGGREIDLNDP